MVTRVRHQAIEICKQCALDIYLVDLLHGSYDTAPPFISQSGRLSKHWGLSLRSTLLPQYQGPTSVEVPWTHIASSSYMSRSCITPIQVTLMAYQFIHPVSRLKDLCRTPGPQISCLHFSLRSELLTPAYIDRLLEQSLLESLTSWCYMILGRVFAKGTGCGECRDYMFAARR